MIKTGRNVITPFPKRELGEYQPYWGGQYALSDKSTPVPYGWTANKKKERKDERTN